LVTPDDTCIGPAAVEFAASQSKYIGLLTPAQRKLRRSAAEWIRLTKTSGRRWHYLIFFLDMFFMCAISDRFVQKFHISVVIKAKNQ